MSTQATSNNRVYLVWAVLIFAPFISYVLFWWLYKLANTYVHYLSGIAISLVAIGILSSLIGWWDDPLLSEAKRIVPKTLRLRFGWLIMGISYSLTTVFISVTMFAWISYSLSRIGFTGCELVDSTQPTYDVFVRTYLWHLGDLIPYLNIGKTLGAPRPDVECQGWVAAPILIFRLFTYIFLFEGIRNAWKTFKTEK